MYTFVASMHPYMSAKLRALSVFKLEARKAAMAEVCAAHLSPELIAALKCHLGCYGMCGKGNQALVDLHSAIRTEKLPSDLHHLYAQALAARYDWLWLVD